MNTMQCNKLKLRFQFLMSLTFYLSIEILLIFVRHAIVSKHTREHIGLGHVQHTARNRRRAKANSALSY